MPVDAVEHAIEDYYRSIELTPAECAEIRHELKEQVGLRLEVAHKQAERHNRRLRDLQNEQQKLVHLYYRGGVSEEVLKAEQHRIEAERTQAHRWVQSATHEAQEAQDAVDEALAIVEGCHATYIAGDSERRRLMNQAIFERLLVRIDHLEGEEQPVYSQIRSLTGTSTPNRSDRPHNGQDPQFLGALGSNVDQMVRVQGL